LLADLGKVVPVRQQIVHLSLGLLAREQVPISPTFLLAIIGLPCANLRTASA
jgi:hypothetical protein